MTRMIATTDDIAGLRAALDLDPSSMVLRGVLADAFDDAHDFDSGECCRWMMEAGIWADCNPVSGCTFWFDELTTKLERANPKYTINGAKKDHLTPFRIWSSTGYDWHCWAWYDTRQQADDALFRDWSRLTPAQRAECWAWARRRKGATT